MFTFIRHVAPDDQVYAKVLSNNEGKISQIGIMIFPNKLVWSKFYGALQAGSLPIRDMEVRMETTNEPFTDQPYIKAEKSPIQLPIGGIIK